MEIHPLRTGSYQICTQRRCFVAIIPDSPKGRKKTQGKFGLTSVAAQVHADTIPEAIRPGLILRDALVNSSELLGENAV